MTTTSRRILLTVVLGTGCIIGSKGVLFSDPLQAAERSVRKGELDATLRKLEQDIARVRGLAFISPVVAKVIHRSRDVAQGTECHYSVREKVLFLYDDGGGGYRRKDLIQGIVHALQDQHFGLEHLLRSSVGTDADLALDALIMGDATFTMVELLKEDDPEVAALLDVAWEKLQDVRIGFIYIQGARYVRALKERGGWEAVNAAYGNPPQCTAAILHPDVVPMVDLGPGSTRGAFSIVQMLVANPETAPQAVGATAGWRGDRAVERGAVRSWVVAFGNSRDALRFQTVMAKWRTAQNPQLKIFLDEPGAKAWRDVKGAIAAVVAHGDRVFVIDAPDDAAYKALLDQLEGPLSLRVYAAKDKGFITFDQFVERLLEAELICVGESHASDLHHRAELQIIKALCSHDGRLGVGMEMFQRPFQQAIDRFLRSELTEDEFLKASEYQDRWGYDWSLYRPVVEFCRRNGIPVAALNVPHELTDRLFQVGIAGLTNAEKARLGDIDIPPNEDHGYWFDFLGNVHRKSEVSAQQMEHASQVMTVWNEYMAASAAEFRQKRRLRRLVVLVGSAHLDRRFGIPAGAARRIGGKVATISFDVGEEKDIEKTLTRMGTDYIVCVLGAFGGDPVSDASASQSGVGDDFKSRLELPIEIVFPLFDQIARLHNAARLQGNS